MNGKVIHPIMRTRIPRSVLVASMVALVVGLSVARSAGAQTDDPALDQTISADEPVVTGAAVIDAGHVDIGPRFVDGEWRLLAHDDSVVPPVWRSLDDVVLWVRDAAQLTVPDDPQYEFLGAAPGTPVHVVPQTEHPEVVWLGWNTQDPEVMRRIDRGATLTLLGVDGPSPMTMFLQSGNLGAPEVLWRSTDPDPQSIWVDVNTHTHANWVFNAPGVYLVAVEVSADLVDGEAVRTTQYLRFAVGDATAVDDARSRAYAGTLAAPDDRAAGDAGPDAAGDAGSSLPIVLVIAGLAVVLVGGVAVVGVRGRRAQRLAEQARKRAGSRS